jgi:hypothetical protein
VTRKSRLRVLIGCTLSYPFAVNAQMISDGTKRGQGPEWNEARKYYDSGGAEIDKSVRSENELTVRNFLKAAKSRKYLVMKSFVSGDAQIGTNKGETTPSLDLGGGPPIMVLTYQPLEMEKFAGLIGRCRLIGLMSMYKAYPYSVPTKMEMGFVMTGWRCAKSKETHSWNFHVGSNVIVSIDDRTISL